MTVRDMVLAIAQSGMSQAQIAGLVGVSQPTIHRILEKGQRVDYETGKKIEAIYSSLGESKAA